jgi:MoxR-like ATPase
MDTKAFVEMKNRLTDNCSRVIVGKDEVIEQVIICLIAGGHVLLEDVPGPGKTMLLRAFAKSIGSSFKRIQFTPDLMPSDLTGINFYNQKEGEFVFRPGPLFSNLILADELNRATPRSQSALLEVMEEKQITVDGVSYRLEEPYMVMATQNPLESYGTFPLPEAQTDRFFMRLKLGYMTREQELSVIGRESAVDIIAALEPAVSAEESQWVRAHYKEVAVHEAVAGYMMDIIEGTRRESAFVTGVSTRGAIALYKASQVTAAFAGRDFVLPEDVKHVAPHVLAHRIVSGSALSSADAEKYIARIIAGVAVPLES